MNIRNLIATLLLVASAALLWWAFKPAEAPQIDIEAKKGPTENYAERDWDSKNQSGLNISLFAFRDRNRNGVYDTADLPMAGVAVELTPEGSAVAEHTTVSNINGYANFEMNLGSTQHPVSEANKTYQFLVQTPPGWRVTSGNAEQNIHFRALPGSVAGLVADKPPHWVGLARELTISWPLPPSDNSADNEAIQVSLTDPKGGQKKWQAGADSAITIDAYPGNWRLRAESTATGLIDVREVQVTDEPVVLSPMRFATSIPAPLPHKVTEHFDWLNRSVLDKIPNGHLGLDWDYLLAVDNQQYRGPGYVNGLTSGHAVGYNSSGHPVTISAPSGKRFDFVRGHFAVAWPKAHGELLDIQAWRDGKLVTEQAVKLSYLGAVTLHADLRSIDRLTLTTRHYWQFVADDLVFRLAEPPQDKPE